MKKIIILFLFIICSFWVNAKDYVPIHLADTAFYTGQDFNIFAVRIDSVRIINNQKFNFLNRTWNEEDYDCIKPNGPSWLGPHFIEVPDSVYYFFNKDNDTINISPLLPLDSSWKFYTSPNGDYYKSTVSRISYEEFLGLSDTVKYFTLNRCDSMGNVVNDEMNGKEFSISKNYGFIQIFDLVNFPESISILTISGKTNPLAGKTFLTPNEIFDFDVGDEFHYVRKWILRFDEGEIEGNGEEIIFIMEKLNSTQPYHFSYKIRQDIHDHSYDDITGSIVDTIYTSITNKEYHFYYIFSDKKYIPNEPMYDTNAHIVYPYSSYIYNFDTSRYNRRIFTYGLPYSQHDTCWRKYEPMKDLKFQYIEGCGLFSSESFVDDLEASTWGESNLVYYKKGDKIWGTPLIITSIEEKEYPSYTRVFPNPVSNSEVLNIQSPQPISYVKIIDLLGREIIKQKVEYKNDFKINLNSIESGVYFILIVDSNNDIQTEKLIVK
ncbi:T9SS type A sorting domain-containing protein [Bacteroidota bacterium]